MGTELREEIDEGAERIGERVAGGIPVGPLGALEELLEEAAPTGDEQD